MEHTDQVLLARYRQLGDDDALQELIRRHLDMVYSAALRLLRDRHLAEDVTQAVFIIFAQKAASLSPAIVLAGWFHRTTRYAALNAMRSKSRRERHEQLASRPERVEDSAAVDWEALAPHLDKALSALRPSYRDAILLRFFRGMNLASVGESMGVSEEAARKLVDRGVSQLRSQLSSANLSCTTAGLTTALAAGAVQSAPAHLAQVVLHTAAAGSGAASLSPLVKGTITMMTWTKTNIAIAAVAATLFIGVSATTLVYATRASTASAKSAPPSAPLAQIAPAHAELTIADSRPADAETTFAVRETMAAVMEAAVSADPDAMKLLSVVTADEHKEIANATLEAILAGKKLRDAATDRFGQIEPSLENILPGGPAIFREVYIPNAPVSLSGDLAIVPVNPDSTPREVAFRKVDGQWRMDMGATFAPTPEANRQYLTRLKRLTTLFPQLAQQIASGECQSQDQAAMTLTNAINSVE